MKKINENTKVTLTLEQLKRLVKESGMTVEEAFDQMERDVRKARAAYKDGSVSETSDILFKIISDAKKVSNRLTEATGGPVLERKRTRNFANKRK